MPLPAGEGGSASPRPRRHSLSHGGPPPDSLPTSPTSILSPTSALSPTSPRAPKVAHSAEFIHARLKRLHLTPKVSHLRDLHPAPPPPKDVTSPGRYASSTPTPSRHLPTLDPLPVHEQTHSASPSLLLPPLVSVAQAHSPLLAPLPFSVTSPPHIRPVVAPPPPVVHSSALPPIPPPSASLAEAVTLSPPLSSTEHSSDEAGSTVSPSLPRSSSLPPLIEAARTEAVAEGVKDSEKTAARTSSLPVSYSSPLTSFTPSPSSPSAPPPLPPPVLSAPTAPHLQDWWDAASRPRRSTSSVTRIQRVTSSDPDDTQPAIPEGDEPPLTHRPSLRIDASADGPGGAQTLLSPPVPVRGDYPLSPKSEAEGLAALLNPVRAVHPPLPPAFSPALPPR